MKHSKEDAPTCKLEQVILRLLGDSSGGMKMPQLITELAYSGVKETPEQILAVIKMSSKLGRLTYTWKGVNRDFIYTP